MHWSWVLVLSMSGLLSAETAAVRPDAVRLGRIKAHMLSILAEQPNYTCTQEIERSTRRAPSHRYELRDMLRLDVALVDGKELYAWPGADQFDDTELTDMAPPGGAIGTGNFASHARAVFGSGAPLFHYEGVVSYGRGNAYRYTFVVPEVASGWRIKVDRNSAIVGYHGLFLADVNTFDLVRLEVEADDIPPHVGVKSAWDAMDYERMNIAGGDFLLPAASELRMVDLNGNESRNRVRFTGCRQFTGESVLTFAGPDELPQTAPPAQAPKKFVPLPTDLVFDVSLDMPIDSRASMVGDRVTATLAQNIKHKHQLLFRKGARLVGRIFRLERHGDHCDVDIRFTEVESDSARSLTLARLDRTVETDYKPLFRSLVQSPHEDQRSWLRLRGRDVHLPRGYRLRLRTEETATLSER